MNSILLIGHASHWAVWGYSSLAGLAVCAVALIGGLAYMIPMPVLRRLLPLGISLSTGVLIGDAFLHLLPESIERIDSIQIVMLEVIAGFVLFFNLEKGVRWRHDRQHLANNSIKPLASMNLLADALHNFIDGTLIGSSFLISPAAGWATTAGLLLHELPQEVGDVGTLLYGGYTIRRALLYNLLAAITCLFGIATILVAGIWLESYLIYALPIAAGGFIYIAASDLIPELHRTYHSGRSWMQSVCMLVGVGLMLWLAVSE